jgi:hypothetical protein
MVAITSSALQLLMVIESRGGEGLEQAMSPITVLVL